MSQTLTVDQIAKLLLIDPRRVQQLVQQGWIPKAVRGQYELIPSLQGYIRFMQNSVQRRGPQDLVMQEKQLDIDNKTENLRKKRMDNDLREKNLLPADQVDKVVGDLLSNLKTRFMNITGRVVVKLDGLTDRHEIHEIVHTEVCDALQDVSNFSLTDDRTQPDTVSDPFTADD